MNEMYTRPSGPVGRSENTNRKIAFRFVRISNNVLKMSLKKKIKINGEKSRIRCERTSRGKKKVKKITAISSTLRGSPVAWKAGTT